MSDDAGAESGSEALSVKCACGTMVPVAPDRLQAEQSCPSCSAKFRVVWAVDPKSRRKVLARVPEKGKSFRFPPGSQQLVCSCGQPLVARKEQAGKRVKCPVCGVSMVIEKYKDPQTLETRVRRSDEPKPVTKARGTEVIAAKSLGRTTRRRRSPSGAQDILCGCGEYLRVFEEHLEKRVMCPACGTLMKMEKIKDPQSSVTTVRPRIVGKTDPPPRLDPEAWSMEDFS